MRFRALLWVVGLASCAPALEERGEALRSAAAPTPSPIDPLSSPVAFLRGDAVRGKVGPGEMCRGAGGGGFAEPPAPGPRSSGAVVLSRRSPDAGIAYVADSDGHAVLTVDVDGGRVLAATALPGEPAHVLALDDGRLAVTLQRSDRLMLLEPTDDPSERLVALCEIATSPAPFALALTPDGATLLVSGEGRLSGHDAHTLATRFEAPIAREPREIEVATGGEKAFVAHVVGGTVSVVDLAAPHAVRRLDLRRERAGRPDRAESSQLFALARVTLGGRERILAPHVAVEPEDAMTYYGQGLEVPVATAIDATGEAALALGPVAATIEERTRPGRCLLPRAAETRGEALYVTCLGNDLLVELDARGADAARLPLRRWNVPAGPLGLAIDGDHGRAVVWSQFARQLSVIPLGGGEPTTIDAPALDDEALPAAVALGRELFHELDDRRITSDGRACASCHPDGRDDAVTWPTHVGDRQTITLAGRLEGTAPYGWGGEHESVAEHAAETARRLGGTGLVRDHAMAVAAYLQWLPARRPLPGADDSVERGRALFFDAAQGCGACHVGGGTDGLRHDVGTGEPIDTPSLRNVAGTAPYFHDGRFATLEALLTAPDLGMGRSRHLPPADRAALIAYLESL
jgi:mono/diheme cytochrome c family protein